MSSAGVLQRLPTLGNAEIGRGLGAEGGGVPCVEGEPQAGLMGPRDLDRLRVVLPSSSVPLLSAARRARCPLRPEGSLGGAETASVPWGSTAGPGVPELGLGAVGRADAPRPCGLGCFPVVRLDTEGGGCVYRCGSRSAD